MSKIIISFTVLIALATISSAEAVQTGYLDLGDQTQEEPSNASLGGLPELHAVPSDPIAEPDDENQGGVIILPEEDTATSDQGHKGEIDILSDTTSAEPTGIEHEDIGGAVSAPDEPSGTTGIDNEDIGVTAPESEPTDAKTKSDTIIKGSTIKENYPESGETVSQDVFFDIFTLTDADLAEHDPGITILEATKKLEPEIQQIITNTKEADIRFLSEGKLHVRSGFVQINDIKGESKAAAGKGKAKEIVVVGSKTKETGGGKATAGLTLKNCKGENLICETGDVATNDNLQEYIKRHVNESDTVQEARVSDKEISVSSTQKAKLFGFIPINLKTKTSVGLEKDNFGKVKVKLPWWHIFSRKTVRPHDFTLDLESRIGKAKISKWQALESKSDSTDPATGPSGEEIITDEQGRTTASESISLNFGEIKAAIFDAVMGFL